jgi:hypothetical protein
MCTGKKKLMGAFLATFLYKLATEDSHLTLLLDKILPQYGKSSFCGRPLQITKNAAV